VLSFFFFMATLVLFYLQQQLMYFVLASAFLIVYIFTMIGWVMQKRNTVSIHENGIAYRKFAVRWDEISSVKSDPQTGITLMTTDGGSTTIGKSVADIGRVAMLIRQKVSGL
jgi:ABC-type bacteriocin/lantibiotic exporter with double-glycine peptidase domain